LRFKDEHKLEPNPDRDSGGRILAKKQWRTFWFSIEVAVESPGDLDEEEAAEDAAEFANVVAHTKGRSHESFCTVVGVHEHGRLQPATRESQKIFGRDNWEHPMERDEEEPKPKKAKPKKSKKKMVKAKRY
jgi:hypothetical protein